MHGLRLPWLLAVLGVCAAGAGPAQFSDYGGALPVLLLLAPLLPLLCVAASYGGKADPFAEVTRTTPAGGLRLLLIRTGQVLVLCVPLPAAATFASSRAETEAARELEVGATGWLLPCLVLTLATLLLSSYVDSRLAALITSCVWLLAVGAIAHVGDDNSSVADIGRPELVMKALKHLLSDTRQLIWAIGAAVLVELLYLRRHAFSTPTPTPGDRRPPRPPRAHR